MININNKNIKTIDVFIEDEQVDVVHPEVDDVSVFCITETIQIIRPETKNTKSFILNVIDEASMYFIDDTGLKFYILYEDTTDYKKLSITVI